MSQTLKTTSSEGILLKGVTKRFGDVTAVDNVSFTVQQGEFMSLLGPSGCGKTTILRSIAGFIVPDSGTIHAGGIEITHLPPFRRNIGLVFQNYALWPHMTVFENIAFGLKLRKMKTSKIKEKVEEVLALTNMSGFEVRYPRELSGGQQQRVALMRAIALEPSILLMDEPLSNLDRKMRISMRVELKQLQQKLGMTTLYVTHDQEEALSMSDRVAIMNQGKVIRVGSPKEIYERPQTEFEADFVGNINTIRGRIKNISDDGVEFATETGFTLKLPLDNTFKTNENVNLTIRPERLKISGEKIDGEYVLPGTVSFVDYFGPIIKYFVDLKAGHQVIVESQNLESLIGVGETVYVKIDPLHCFFLRPDENNP